MKLFKSLAVAAVSLSIVSCDYQKNNTIKQKDFNEGNDYVYGVHPDSAAAQSKNTYDSKPELGAKANEIRDILFNDSTNLE